MPKCISPVYIKGDNGYIGVPCGKCYNCLQNNWQQWIFRNMEELKHSKIGLTITLTYDEQHLPILNGLGPSVLKRDIQLFLKRLRSKLPKECLKYMIVSEYGKNYLRPHYHGMLYFNSYCTYTRDKLEDIIQKSWHMGFIKFDGITAESVAYTTKYLLKDSPQPSYGEPTFMLSSRRPAIGSKYVEDNYDWYKFNVKKSYIQLTGGGKVGLPRYIKNKLEEKRMEVLLSLSNIKEWTELYKNQPSFQELLKERDEFEKEQDEILQKQFPQFNIHQYKSEQIQEKIYKFNRKLKEHAKKEKF